jgi:hypothetical protein
VAGSGRSQGLLRRTICKKTVGIILGAGMDGHEARSLLFEQIVQNGYRWMGTGRVDARHLAFRCIVSEDSLCIL